MRDEMDGDGDYNESLRDGMYDAHEMPVPIPYHLVWVPKAKPCVARWLENEPVGKIFARGLGF